MGMYGELVRLISKKLHPLWQSLGFFILPNSYDEPVPDTRSLDDRLWDGTRYAGHIDYRESEQLRLLDRFMERYGSEYREIPRRSTPDPRQYHTDNSAFGSVDGEMLYCFIRENKPGKIVEIGSGHSTLLAAQALRRNRKEDERAGGELVAIEPYPSGTLRGGVPGMTSLIDRPVQVVPIDLFRDLGKNDILFIDSSHVLKIGSDVQHVYFHILPALPRGVLVHIHDIFLPAEYPREWILKNRWFGNEEYLLYAFLLFNGAFRMEWSSSFMHLTHADRLETAFPSYDTEKNWPGSMWLRRVR